jgi:hypothetical protein
MSIFHLLVTSPTTLQCRSAECKDFDVTFHDKTFNLLIWSTFYHQEHSAVVRASFSPEKNLYSNRRPKNPYSDEVWGVEGQWLHRNSLAAKKVSNFWIGIVLYYFDQLFSHMSHRKVRVFFFICLKSKDFFSAISATKK